MSKQQENLRKLFTDAWLTEPWPFIWRVTLGVLMMAFHGAPKVLDGKLAGMIQDLTELGWPMPTLQAFFAGYIEFAGGILLILGLFTRPIAFATIILFGIITFVYLGTDPFVAKEKAFLFFVIAIYIFLHGPGKYSIDALIFRKPQA